MDEIDASFTIYKRSIFKVCDPHEFDQKKWMLEKMLKRECSYHSSFKIIREDKILNIF